MNLLRMVVGAAVPMLPIAQLEADPVQPAVGMYALESRPVAAGSTCVINIFGTPVAWEIPFSYLYYSGPTATSTLYVTDNNAGGADQNVHLGKGLPTPGHVVTVTLPMAPATGIGTWWSGVMIWSENPWTLQPPSVQTSFSLKATVVDKNVFVFTIVFFTPGAAGLQPSCTDVSIYTAVRTGM